jgi:hypothetical protein
MTKVLSRQHTVPKFNIDYDNPKFVLLDGVITNWSADNSQSQPTEEQLIVWYDGLTDYWTTQDILNTRTKRYPSWQDQMDMQYHDKVDGTSTWQDAVAKVKSDNPKP